MTKKHFILIAEIISTITYENERSRIADLFADELEERFPAFKKDIFLDYIEDQNKKEIR